ncbi:hypothetical protein EIN_053940 [Entamoeba invadens IP1]|uniref:hypothetical protein n=1 Tax=Entamoeba invadens IP1 TaxID=370355 RepID=UPI0002C3EED9|nr:hypothetical protein EIN_053940 [Entamoeba invadens IP1]ELP93129.1 hypothetical protein EIN_053940 [Entamoeba invadens IP1]|eukprot:XP_004259900.1 hypothetical protein EIN_053940 [Entamoeba invadens IP1]
MSFSGDNSKGWEEAGPVKRDIKKFKKRGHMTQVIPQSRLNQGYVESSSGLIVPAAPTTGASLDSPKTTKPVPSAEALAVARASSQEQKKVWQGSNRNNTKSTAFGHRQSVINVKSRNANRKSQYGMQPIDFSKEYMEVKEANKTKARDETVYERLEEPKFDSADYEDQYDSDQYVMEKKVAEEKIRFVSKQDVLFRPNWIQLEQIDLSERSIQPKFVCCEANTVLIVCADELSSFLLYDGIYHPIKNNYKNRILKAALDPTGMHVVLLYAENKMGYCNRNKLQPDPKIFSFPQEILAANKEKVKLEVTALKFDQKTASTELTVFAGTSSGCIFKILVFTRNNPINFTFQSIYPIENKRVDIRGTTGTLRSALKTPREKAQQTMVDTSTIIDIGPVEDLYFIDSEKVKMFIVSNFNYVVALSINADSQTNKYTVEDLSERFQNEVMVGSKSVLFVDPLADEKSSFYKVCFVSAAFVDQGKVFRKMTRLIAQVEVKEIENFDTVTGVDQIKKLNIYGNGKSSKINADCAIDMGDELFLLFQNKIGCYDFDTKNSCEQQIDGKSISLSIDHSTKDVVVCTEYCLYNIRSLHPKIEKNFDVQLLKNIGNSETMLFYFVRRLDEILPMTNDRVKRIQAALLYVWSITLILKNAFTEDAEKVEEVKTKLKVVLHKKIYAKRVIDEEIVSYLFINAGDDKQELFKWFCNEINNLKFLFKYYLLVSNYVAAVGVLDDMYASKDEDVRLDCKKLVKKYFGVLFKNAEQEFAFFLNPPCQKQIFTGPDMAISLSLVAEMMEFSDFESTFVHWFKDRIAKKYESEYLIEIFFWRLVKYKIDQQKNPTEEVDRYFASYIRDSPTKFTSVHFFRELKNRKFYFSLLDIYTTNRQYINAIDTIGDIFRMYHLSGDAVRDLIRTLVEKKDKLPNEEEDENVFVVKMLKLKIEANDKKSEVGNLIDDDKIPVQSVLASLSLLTNTNTKLEKLKACISNTFEKYKSKDLENSKKINELVEGRKKGIASLGKAGNILFIEHSQKQYIHFSVAKQCALCFQFFDKNAKNDVCIGFTCDHFYHASCILKEIKKHQTPWALEILRNYNTAGQELKSEQLTKECILCSKHVIQLGEFELDDDHTENWDI